MNINLTLPEHALFDVFFEAILAEQVAFEALDHLVERVLATATAALDSLACLFVLFLVQFFSQLSVLLFHLLVYYRIRTYARKGNTYVLIAARIASHAAAQALARVATLTFAASSTTLKWPM